jgi:O-acetyl-ADP-ribose deacetylase (regulator of RNase III)
MVLLTYETGDATAPIGGGRRIIAHVCNDIGAWGAGFVLAVSRRWPQPEAAYRQWHAGRAGNDFALGAVQRVQVEPELWVANMVGQHGIRRAGGKPPIRYEALEQCLARLAAHARELHAAVHMPRIGAGLAGGKWEDIEPLLLRTLCAADVRTVVYGLP